MNGNGLDDPRGGAAAPRGFLASAALGAWAAELVRTAELFPIAAMAGGLAALILCSRRRIAPRWALAGSVAACAARLSLPVADPVLAPASAPWPAWGGAALGPLTGAGRALLLAWVCLGGALLPRFAPRAERGESTAPVLVIGLFLAAAGAAAQTTALGRIAGRVGLGTPEDTAVFVTAAAALLFAGSVTLGALLQRSSIRTVILLILGASVLGLFALAVAGGVTSPTGFAALCERFGADRSLAGTARVNAAVAATVLVAPALALGAAATGLQDLRAFAAAVAGAALGVWASRWLLPVGGEELPVAAEALGSSSVVRSGAWLVASGAAFAAGRSAPRLAAAAAVALAATLLPLSAVRVERPWDRFPAPAAVVFETRAGQFTLEERRGGERSAWLDQRALTPAGETARLDARCLAETLALHARPDDGSARLDIGEARIALLGLLTPERTAALREGGARAVDRVTAFPAAAARVEDWLLDPLEPDARLGGDHVELSSLEGYDLVITPPVGAEVAARWTAVPWTGRSEARWASVDRPLMLAAVRTPLLAGDGLRGTAVGIAGPEIARASGPRALGWLAVRPDERRRAAGRIATARLARSRAEERPLEFLRRHADAQRASSPFEADGERIEISAETLTSLRDHVLAQELQDPVRLGSVTVALVEDAAEVLRAQREVPWTFEFLAPIAARSTEPWPALERALAWAEMEELRPADAARRLEALGAQRTPSPMDRRALASAYVELGRGSEAAELLEPLHLAAPADRGLAADLAEALVVAGDPRGRRLAAELLADDPLDGRLMALARGLRSLDPGAAQRALDGR
ncbi:MAG: hypothetical protein VX460_12880 [Planctomycetota bacterium]|nr:hypothetical protein [Planctomycetota bacterium]